jgi:hypothetical protein
MVAPGISSAEPAWEGLLLFDPPRSPSFRPDPRGSHGRRAHGRRAQGRVKDGRRSSRSATRGHFQMP